MAKNLNNLTAVTTVNDSDLLHVNQGSVSSDKKVTKANLLKEVNSSITSLNNSLTNSLTCDTIFDQKNIPSTFTQYNCNWQNYNFLIIQAVQYGNKRANIFIPYASFYGTNSGNRPQIYDPLAQCTYEVYQNGSGKIYASCNAPTTAIGLIIYGLAKR